MEDKGEASFGCTGDYRTDISIQRTRKRYHRYPYLPLAKRGSMTSKATEAATEYSPAEAFRLVYSNITHTDTLIPFPIYFS
jgi:hypothetical protein